MEYLMYSNLLREGMKKSLEAKVCVNTQTTKDTKETRKVFIPGEAQLCGKEKVVIVSSEQRWREGYLDRQMIDRQINDTFYVITI